MEIVKSPGAASPPSDWKFSDYGGRVSPIRSLGVMYSRCCLFCELARPQNRGSYSSPLRWKDSTGWEAMSPPSDWKFQFIIGLGLSSQLGTPEVEWGGHVYPIIPEIPRKWWACTPPSDWEYPQRWKLCFPHQTRNSQKKKKKKPCLFKTLSPPSEYKISLSVPVSPPSD